VAAGADEADRRALIATPESQAVEEAALRNLREAVAVAVDSGAEVAVVVAATPSR
jgi:hypothetical protein